MKALSKQQAKLFTHLFKAGTDVDVPILDLWEAMYGNRAKGIKPRTIQQYVGAVVTRTNAKLGDAGRKIKPGQLKRTYRLTNVA